MKVITGKRGCGKTTTLIKLAHTNSAYLVVESRLMAKVISDKANKMNLSIPYPLTYDEFIKRQYYSQGIKKVYIDNIDLFLTRIGQGVTVEGFSVTPSDVLLLNKPNQNVEEN